MAKTTKKVDVKKVAKKEVSTEIKALFEEKGIVVGDGQDYGMTEGTLVLQLDKCDVQVKLITPKTGETRYEKLEDDEEEEVEEEPEPEKDKKEEKAE